MAINIEIVKILDKHLPAKGVGTEQEKLRMDLLRDLTIMLNNRENLELSFNNIADLRPFLLTHPDQQMVEASCLHYLGDNFQIFIKN